MKAPMTPEQLRELQIENLLVAHALFTELPASSVNLSSWTNCALRSAQEEGGLSVHTCGAVGCFGGWIAVHPHFRKQGVRQGFDGRPQRGHVLTWDLARALFGNSDMFVGSNWAAGRSATDKAEVMARIEYALGDLAQGDA